MTGLEHGFPNTGAHGTMLLAVMLDRRGDLDGSLNQERQTRIGDLRRQDTACIASMSH
ncbi:unnamed protein product [Penicillium camemberti]|uniref:Str. FM013 n=1 Tax=Penicillium camemberti (strain FM 013) TaxID=1429867 RepID=A0A0G4P3S4_PENC3|nr:unnamed protein product [Penicillium camemberti]